MADSRHLPALRAAFLVAVVAFAWFGLRGRFNEIGSALQETSVLGAAGALAVILLGLLATGALWLRLMSAVGADLPARDGLSMFFIGQLGKYIPGSVWSIGAQAQMAGQRSVPPRSTVAAGLLFLGYHVATAVLVGTSAVLLGDLESPWPTWLSALLLVGSAVGLLPVVVRWAGRRIAGTSVRLGFGDTAVALVLMTATWTAYAGALVLLAPGFPWHDVLSLGGAFTLAYAVGVVVVLAPAGVGARDALLVLLLTPLLGVADATALALLARLAHTAADGTMAAGWWYASRLRPARESAATRPTPTPREASP